MTTYWIALGGLLAFCVITFYNAKLQQIRINELTSETRLLTAEATILQMAATIAAPHIRKDMTPAESEMTVRMWIPIAREIVMNHHPIAP